MKGEGEFGSVQSWLWSRIAKIYNLLKPKKKGDINMPSYTEYQIGNKKITVRPSGFKRGLFIRSPYFNGSDINFDVIITIPYMKNIDESISLSWSLIYIAKSESKLIRSELIEFSYSNKKHLLKIKPRKYDYYWNKQEKIMKFIFPKAIVIGNLWDISTYDLTLKESSQTEEKIVTEFTLKDIDEFGLNYLYILIAGVIGVITGAIGGIIASIIYSALGG